MSKIIFFIFLYSSHGQTAPPCHQDCESLKEYRKKNVDFNVTELKPSHATPSRSVQSVSKSQSFYACLRDTAEKHNKVIQEDLKKIEAAFASHKAKFKEITPDKLSQYVDQRVEKLKPHINISAMAWLEFNGSTSAMRISLDGGVLKAGVKDTYHSVSGMEELSGKNGQALINFLLKRAQQKGQRTIKYDESSQAITPTVAKLFLLEIFRSEGAEAFLPLAESLKLKMNLNQEIVELDETVKLNNSGPLQGHDRFAFHNGYFLGSRRPHLEGVHGSTGTDCTLFVQSCLIAAEVTGAEGVKLLSKSMANIKHIKTAYKKTKRKEMELKTRKFLNEHFDSFSFTCENQLKPMDIIAVNGHVAIFHGYDSEGNLITLEAIGRNQRSLGLFKRDVYPEDDSCQKFQISRKHKPLITIFRIKE